MSKGEEKGEESERNTIYLVEQKMRDDHDSSKKRGQYDNFRRKYLKLKEDHPDSVIEAVMWFIDDSMTNNRNYYLERAEEETEPDINIHSLYGRSFFTDILNRPEVWDEICSHLEQSKKERSDDVLEVPDFDTSPEMLNALKRLKKEHKRIYRKLISDDPKYKQLRAELFPTEHNLNLIKD